MADMKLTPKESKDKSIEAQELVQPMYPWGLTINLENESLEKLGLAKEKMEVGQYLEVTARCCVRAVSENETINDGVQRNVSLQIEEMEAKPEGMKDKTVNKIYKRK